MLTNLQLDALERNALAATKGRWYRDGSNYRNVCGGLYPTLLMHADSWIAWDNDKDADYVVAAQPQVVLRLIAALRAADAVVEAVRENIENDNLSTFVDVGNAMDLYDGIGSTGLDDE